MSAGPLQYMQFEPAPGSPDRGRVWFLVLRHDRQHREVYLRTVVQVGPTEFATSDDLLPRSESSLHRLHLSGSEVTALEWLQDNTDDVSDAQSAPRR